MIDVRPLSLTRVIARHGHGSAERDAVVCGTQRRSWRQLVSRMHQVANALIAGGLRPGGKVATLLNNSTYHLESHARDDRGRRCHRPS